MMPALNNFKNGEYSINFKGDNKTEFNKQNPLNSQVSKAGKIDDSYGRALVKPAIFHDIETSKTVYLKNGCAYDENGNKYTGIICHKDKCRNEWELYYVNGKIKSSTKNGQPYKSYNYMSKVPPQACSYVKLDDGSKMSAEQFYGYHDAKKISVNDFENGRNIILILNPKAKYKNEPLVTRTIYQNGAIQKQENLKADGEEKNRIFLFSSTDEANKYFMSKYGMITSFDTIIQAQIVKSAIDDLCKLDAETKKLLPIISIKSAKLRRGEIARASISDMVWYEDEELMSKYNKIGDYQERADFLQKNKPDEIFIQHGLITLNENIDWNDNECIRSIFKVKSADTLKGAIAHELGHIIHACSSPYKFIAFGLQKPDDISQEVSDYATSNKNEFVAEYIGGRLEGKNYSSKITALYREYGGPNLFNDWEE